MSTEAKSKTKRGRGRPRKPVPAARPSEGENAYDTVTIEIPVGPVRPNDYLTEHVEVQLGPTEKRGLRRLVEGVLRMSPLLANGRKVASNPDAIRYLLQLIDEAAITEALNSGR